MQIFSKIIYVFLFILIGVHKSYGDELANKEQAENFKNDLKEMRQIFFEEECRKQCESSGNKNICTEKCVNDKFKEIDQGNRKGYILSGSNRIDSSCTKVVANGCVVTFEYTLTDNNGNFIDSSRGSKPRVYLQGEVDLLPAIMRALDGKHFGEKFEVVLTPSEGYGEYDKSLIKTFPRSAFGDIEKIEKGQDFKTKTPDGADTVVTVVSVENGIVTVDGNHPLSGKTLKFSIEIISIGKPTGKEIFQ